MNDFSILNFNLLEIRSIFLKWLRAPDSSAIAVCTVSHRKAHFTQARGGCCCVSETEDIVNKLSTVELI